MIELWKDGQKTASAEKVTKAFELKGEVRHLQGLQGVGLWYFGSIDMTPPVMFEHLAGTGLMKFLDNCELVVPKDSHIYEGQEVPSKEMRIGPLRYVHGRSEVMKGSHSVTAVLLARPELEQPIPDSQWFSYLPEIYKEALRVMDLRRVTREKVVD